MTARQKYGWKRRVDWGFNPLDVVTASCIYVYSAQGDPNYLHIAGCFPMLAHLRDLKSHGAYFNSNR